MNAIKIQFQKKIGTNAVNPEIFKDIEKVSIDGLISEEDEVIDEGLFAISEPQKSVFLSILSLLYPPNEFELYGYSLINRNSSYRTDIEPFDTVLLPERRYEEGGPLCQPFFSNITDTDDPQLKVMIEKEGYGLFSYYFQSILIFEKEKNHKELMSAGFWLKDSEIDLDDPLHEARNVPNLLEYCENVMLFGSGETHSYPVIYGRKLNIFDINRKIQEAAKASEAETILVPSNEKFMEPGI